MAARKPRDESEKKTAAEYYELKTKAVDDLVNANVTNAPEVSRAELRKYRHRGKFRIPEPVKYFLEKWWFAGVVCWFLMIGLSTVGVAPLDLAVAMGIAYGMLMHAFVNGYLRSKAETPGENDAWMLFPKKGIPWLVCNVGYGAALVLLVMKTYAALGIGNMVEPILFGTFVAAWDGVFLLGKRLYTVILRDAKKKAG